MVTVAAGVAIAGPSLAADLPPGAQISAINNSDAVNTVDDPASSAQAQIAEAEAQAKAARKTAKVATQAANKAKRIAAQATGHALRTRSSSDVRTAQLAQLAAKKATAKMKAAKAAAKKATARADAMRASATRATGQRGFTASPSAGASTTSDNNRSLVLELANQARSLAGCGPLSYNSQLERAAQGHAEDMQKNNFMSHVSHDGRTFDQRIRAAGFDGGRIGENVGAGFSTPDSVSDAWMHSPAHRANILDCRFNYLGVGYALTGGYWVQNFGA